MKLKLVRNPESNEFCVPAALALITGMPVDDIITLMRNELGDQPITGLYYPFGLKILVRLGYQYDKVEMVRVLTKRLHPERFYYCASNTHCFVIHDHKIWDNQNPEGIPVPQSLRVSQCWEVWK